MVKWYVRHKKLIKWLSWVTVLGPNHSNPARISSCRSLSAVIRLIVKLILLNNKLIWKTLNFQLTSSASIVTLKERLMAYWYLKLLWSWPRNSLWALTKCHKPLWLVSQKIKFQAVRDLGYFQECTVNPKTKASSTLSNFLIAKKVQPSLQFTDNNWAGIFCSHNVFSSQNLV